MPYEFHSCDVRDDDAVKELIDTIVDRHGRLDVVVNNAGGSPYVLTAESSAKFNRKIVELNLFGALSVSQHANDRMQNQQQGGSIINVCSLSGRRPSPGTAAYGAAKAGLLNLTETLATEWAPKVRVVSVTCGLIETEKSDLHYGDAAGVAAVTETVPMDRMGTPDDVADACLFLSSEQAAFITGGGLTLHGGNEKEPAYLMAARAAAARHG